MLPIRAIFGLKLGPHTPPKGPQKWARNMPPKDRIWVTKRRRPRVSDRWYPHVQSSSQRVPGRLLGSDQPFRRQPLRSKNSKKRPDFRKQSPKTLSVQPDVPRSGPAEAIRSVYICAASAASQRHASWPFSCGGASPPQWESAADATGFCGELGIGVGPSANRLPPRWIGSNGRLRHRVSTAAATDATVAAISPPAARAVRATPALVDACDGAPQACWWRWVPPSGRWRLLGR